MTDEDRISALEAGAQPLRERMEARATAWKAAAAEWLADWWRDATERAIKQNPERVKELAAEGRLPALKRDVETLLATAVAVVEEEFGADALWIHRQPESDPRERGVEYRGYGNRDPKHLDEPMRRAMGRVGTLLIPAGLGAPPGQTDVFADKGDGYRYSIGFSWGTDMRASMQSYAALHDDLAGLLNQIDEAKRAQATREAQALWEDA